MPKALWIALLVGLTVLLYKQFIQHDEFEVLPSVLASQQADVVQTSDASTSEQLDSSYQVNTLEAYEGQFRVLSRKAYNSGREAQFSPLDVAVGWGEMARPEIYQQIEIKQRNRWYYWQTDVAPIPVNQISSQSANMHLVPANAEIAQQLQKIDEDDLVYLKGALIEIKSQDGWRWRSSLSRTDTGQGACELMRVDEIRWQ